ncbi:hypothetical protein C8R45DRAFT_1113689 [Mycena sanguinolenta]|nr:hypothetical protein C8R45DRAFT_1113689 [Mycena sanguinolenta]
MRFGDARLAAGGRSVCTERTRSEHDVDRRRACGASSVQETSRSAAHVSTSAWSASALVCDRKIKTATHHVASAFACQNPYRDSRRPQIRFTAAVLFAVTDLGDLADSACGRSPDFGSPEPPGSDVITSISVTLIATLSEKGRAAARRHGDEGHGLQGKKSPLVAVDTEFPRGRGPTPSPHEADATRRLGLEWRLGGHASLSKVYVPVAGEIAVRRQCRSQNGKEATTMAEVEGGVAQVDGTKKMVRNEVRRWRAMIELVDIES